MGTTLASSSHFVVFELLQPRRQATVIVVGCIFIFFLLAHSVDYFSTHRFWVLPFTASPSGCPFGFPCGRPSRTERFYRKQVGTSLAISTSAAWNIWDFSAFLFPGIFHETCVSFFIRSLTQPSNERLAFFRLTELIRLLFSSNLWLFCCANPKAWMIRFFTQLRASPRFHYFKVTFYRWPDISKICDHPYPCKYFWPFVSTLNQLCINMRYKHLLITWYC